jgi:hypothetical protein
MLSFSISYPDLIKFPYFADTTESEGDFTDNLPRYYSFHKAIHLGGLGSFTFTCAMEVKEMTYRKR